MKNEELKAPRTDSLHIPSRSMWARMRGGFQGDENSPPARCSSRNPREALRHQSTANPSFGGADDLRPRKAPDGDDLLVDLTLRRFIAKDAPEVQQLGRHQLVVLRQEAGCGALEIAVGDGDELWSLSHLCVHMIRNVLLRSR